VQGFMVSIEALERRMRLCEGERAGIGQNSSAVKGRGALLLAGKKKKSSVRDGRENASGLFSNRKSGGGIPSKA